MTQILSLIFLVALLALAPCLANAQNKLPFETCSLGGAQAPGIGFWMWTPGARVQVYVRSTDFTAPQLSSMLTALENWNNVSEQTESGVKFEYKGNAVQQLTCENCLTIMRAAVFDKRTRHATEIHAHSAAENQIITYAAILVDPVLTNPKAIQNALVHELGHNLGLLDCFTCKRKSSVMTQFEAVNIPNNMERPTLCDIAQVRTAYEKLKVLVRAAPVGRNAGSEDEGEEPVDDDSPVVVPAQKGGSPFLKPSP